MAYFHNTPDRRLRVELESQLASHFFVRICRLHSCYPIRDRPM